VDLGDSKYRSKLSKAIADGNKYVALDLRGVPMNAIFDRGTLSDAAIVKIVSLTLPESVTKIADHLHGNYPDLKVEERGVFYGYTALKTISLPAVTYIGTFGDCVNLTSLTPGDGGSVTAYSFMNTGKDTADGFTIKAPTADKKAALETKIADSTQLGSSQLASTWYTALHDPRTDRFNQGKFKGVEVW
jgi:hypothetical protein